MEALFESASVAINSENAYTGKDEIHAKDQSRPSTCVSKVLCYVRYLCNVLFPGYSDRNSWSFTQVTKPSVQENSMLCPLCFWEQSVKHDCSLEGQQPTSQG